MAQEQQEPQEPQEQQQEQGGKKHRSWLVGLIAVVVLIIVVIVVLLLLLRGCSPSPNTSASSTTPSQSASAVADLDIANKVHAAIHPLSLGNSKPLDTLVYIIEAVRSNGKVVATIRLDVASNEVARNAGGNSAAGIAKLCEDAVISKVPEVTTVKVVDDNGALVGSRTRQ